ncbi:CHAT domain-containing protein [Streptomyces sp. ML-6]|uniref:CHAT domain-containing protein n=1 Tax=Streptomyces sp. ML-6 TaxID=2982693 RepID=UPI0024BF90FF|nr:CHAT domain-containing protein [Streptomyces sp. ML-6]MDK0520681.1 CHAT domain-containing protein [Streptomyces sp. ML-6]
MNDIDDTGDSRDAGLRERVADAVRRSEGARSLPAGYAVPAGPQGAERDVLMSELRSLVAELEQDLPDDPLRQEATARLGALTGSRWAADGEEADRHEAIRLLRAARASGLLAPDDRLGAARELVVLLLGPTVRTPPGHFDNAIGLDGFSLLMQVGKPASLGGAGVIEALPEIRRLAEEIGEQGGGIPPGTLQGLSMMSEYAAALNGGDVQGLMAMCESMLSGDLGPPMPPGPLGSVVQTLLPLVKLEAQRTDGGPKGKPAPTDGKPDTAEEEPVSADEEPADDPAVSGGPGADQRRPSALSAADPASAVSVLSAPDPDDNLRDALALLAEMNRPGVLARDEFTELLTRLGDPGQGANPGDQVLSALGAMGLGMRTGRPEEFQKALRLIREAATAAGPDDDKMAWMVRGMLPGVLVGAMTVGGSLQDLAEAEALLEELLTPDEGTWAGSPPELPGLKETLMINQCLRVHMRAVEAEDAETLEALVGDLLDILDTCDDSEWSFLPLYELGVVHLSLAALTGSVDSLRSAVHYQEQALTRPDVPLLAQPMLDMSWAPLLTLSSFLEPSVERIREGVRRTRTALEGVPVMADQRARARSAIGLALDAVYGMTGDPAVLDEMITELECTGEELEAASGGSAAAVGWQLADAYGRRAGNGGNDLVRAVECARQSLRTTADDVLLQQGVQHGLQVARTGASRALAAAGWAVRAGRPADAVACLEEGRALVLGAAAASATVADRLAERGEHELAGQWRREAARGSTGARAGGSRSELAEVVLGESFGTPELPSALRRRALELLRPAGGEDAPGRIPDASELVAAVGRAGTDALVYLLPGQGDADGAAVLLAPGRDPWTLPLPGLSAGGRAPLDGYLDAAARHATARRGQQRWEVALDELCAWAGEAVMGPVLDELGLWERGLAESGLTGGGPAEPVPNPAPEPEPEPGPGPGPEPVRLTLIACGNLGVVPWQAALLTVPPAATSAPASASAPDGRPVTVRACEVAVLSYTASGREFVRSVGRERLPADLGQALVCVPGWDLDGAEDEVLALAETYYPGAALYGSLMTGEPAPEPPEGTPETVLALLGAVPGRDGADRVALVHLACHGMAGPDPAASALELDPAEETEPESGRLTVTALLDALSTRAEDGGGPLVVLSACETDLSTRDHDEALTLSTALAHRLAADVVGSRWTVPDVASSVLMTVFHDRLDAGLAPPDALRAAQRWMLAPPGSRPPVRGLTPELLRAAEELDLSVPFAWAAFIHQGNPGPAAVRAGGPGGKEPVPVRGETRR